MEVSREELARFCTTVSPHLNEVQRRVVAGAMAASLGRGGKSAVAEASGMSRNTVSKAEREVSAGIEPSDRQRAIRRWWNTMGRPRFPAATKLLMTADAGGSNGYRVKLWKVELAKLAPESGLEITICHYPPGTSKWTRSSTRSSGSSP